MKSQCRVRCDDSVNLTAGLLPGIVIVLENSLGWFDINAITLWNIRSICNRVNHYVS